MEELAPPPNIRAVSVIHQEGVLGILALVGLAYREPGPVASLLPHQGWLPAVAVGGGLAAASLLLLAAAHRIPAVRSLERWQVGMVRRWSMADVVAVAVMSGLCEEALLRALAVPWFGVLPSAALFAALHFVPDRRLWAWPVIAFLVGLALGWAFVLYGYPAAATAHVAINLVSLVRLLRRSRLVAEEPS